MRWCFLLSFPPFLMEFLGKLSYRIVKEGDGCILAADSKIAEYGKKKRFSPDVKILSKVDWCLENYKKNQKEFGNLSWKEFFPDFDRFKLFKFGYNNSVEMVSQFYQFINFLFQKEKPDILIYEPPSGAIAELFYYFCKKNNITYFGLVPSKFEGRIDVYDLEHTDSKYEKTFREIKNISGEERSFAQNFIKNFLSHKQLPSYMKYHNTYYNQIGRLKNYLKRAVEIYQPWLKYFLKRKYFKSFDYKSEIEFKYDFRYPKKVLTRRLKFLFQKNIYDSLDDNDKFFLFPLQSQPEYSTLILARYFSDQVNTIKNAAFSLPFPYKLYVKEHPIVQGDRPRNFYRKIKQIPNVVLVSPYENVENLIKKSQGVITLTSTVGMEAALAGKPVYVLGDVFYSYHPWCRKVNGFEELKQRIEADLNRESFPGDLENVNLRFIISYFRNTIAGDIAAASSKNDTNDYQAIYQDIKRMFLYGKTNFI